ncbi:HotDog domain-containing protein [Schizophyllum fasciatum]
MASHALLRSVPFALRRQTGEARRHNSSIHALLQAFKDPSSPFHLRPGEAGPASPDEMPSGPADAPHDAQATAKTQGTVTGSAVNGPSAHSERRAPGARSAPPATLAEARAAFVDRGYDPAVLWEQRVAWGDLDSFQHVNNVRYVRFFETSRIHWMTTFGARFGGPSAAEALLKGKGVSLILKSIQVNFRRPVTHPDTLVVAHKPHRPANETGADTTHLHLRASAYSLKQRAFVAHAEEVVVWYDYDRLKKCVPEQGLLDAVWATAGKREN